MKKVLYIILSLMLVTSSCNKEEVITTVLPPEITLVDYAGQYTVKQGEKLTIAPEYESVENAAFSWVIDGKEVSTDRFLIFSSDEVGETTISLTVTNESGSDKEEIKVVVVELDIPVVSLANADKGFTVAVDAELHLIPSVKPTSLPQSYTWWVDGEQVSTELEYVFKSSVKGTHNLKFEATTDDGSSHIEFSVNVMDETEISFQWEFEKTVYNYSTGRSILIRPVSVNKTEGVTYTWNLDGQMVQEGEKPEWICSLSEVKQYKLEVVASMELDGSLAVLSQDLEINVCPAEGKYKRSKTGTSKADCNEVYEFLAAPGQFVNENYSATTMDEAAALAKDMLGKNWILSLGGFGGYVVVGFDHSVSNGADHDFGIYGNAFDGSSEPGIVWVMQDENGDGKPNDTWYELKGSETGKPETIQNYAVTYYRPVAPGMPVQWTDSEGQSGSIDYLQFHTQDYYYPAWVKEDSYTLRGTCLKATNYQDKNTGNWIQPAYGWGYADNFSAEDFVNKEGKLKGNANLFDIDNAVDYAGHAIKLNYIDFVKVQNGVNAKSGWLGELSTEVSGFFDYSMMK